MAYRIDHCLQNIAHFIRYTQLKMNISVKGMEFTLWIYSDNVVNANNVYNLTGFFFSSKINGIIGNEAESIDNIQVLYIQFQR